MAEPHILSADVSDPEDHVAGPYDHFQSASDDHRTQEMPETLGSPLTDSKGLTSPMIAASSVNDLENKLVEPALTHSYCTTMKEEPDEDAPPVPYAQQLN